MTTIKMVEEIERKLPEYTKEELKDLWVKCFCERGMLICSIDFKSMDYINQERRRLLESLKLLQEAVEDRMETIKSLEKQ